MSAGKKQLFLIFVHHPYGAGMVFLSFTICTIVYCEQMARPRGAIFCVYMHVEKIPLPAKCQANCKHPWPTFQCQRFESSTLGSSNVIVLQTVTDMTKIAIANTESCMWPFDWHIFAVDIGPI